MNKKSLFLIIFAGILWGTSGIFVNAWKHFGLETIQMTSIRIMVSFPCILVYAMLFNRKALRAKLKDVPLYLVSGITLFTTAAFYYSSMQHTSISTAVVLMYMAPALVLAWSVAFFGEKLTVKKISAILCMIVGCGLVSGIVTGLSFNAFGIAMGLLSGLSYGTYSILTKIQMRHKCNPVTATLYSFFFAAILSVFTCNFSAIHSLINENPAAIITLAVTHGVVTFVLPYSLYTLSLKNIPAGVASAMAIFEPLAATVFSIILFGERLSVCSAIGIALILGPVLVLSRGDD